LKVSSRAFLREQELSHGKISAAGMVLLGFMGFWQYFHGGVAERQTA